MIMFARFGESLRRESKIRFCGTKHMNPSISDVAMAISSTTRMAILKAIRSNRTLTEIAAEVGIAASTLTYHVTVLHGAGLVRVEQTGSRKYLVCQYREVSLALPGRS